LTLTAVNISYVTSSVNRHFFPFVSLLTNLESVRYMLPKLALNEAVVNEESDCGKVEAKAQCDVMVCMHTVG
jgi:hypothetical protein